MRRSIFWHAKLLPAHVGRKDMQSLLRYLDVETDRQFETLHPDQIVNWVIQATRKPWFMRNRRCLREGLLGMRFMRLAGYDPSLVFGVNPKSIQTTSMSAHCWVELDGVPVLNDAQGMEEVYRWPDV
ncbi:MAG: lasso peptide biosynthesis B2 protein [Pseudomonadota bacterium]